MSDGQFDRTKSKWKLLINYININFRLRNLVNLALKDTSIFSMISCFDKFLGFKRIMSDGLDRKVAMEKIMKLILEEVIMNVK